MCVSGLVIVQIFEPLCVCLFVKPLEGERVTIYKQESKLVKLFVDLYHTCLNFCAFLDKEATGYSVTLEIQI